MEKLKLLLCFGNELKKLRSNLKISQKELVLLLSVVQLVNIILRGFYIFASTKVFNENN